MKKRNTNPNRKVFAYCTECNSKIRFDVRPVFGEFVYCPECDTVLEVINENPLKLTWAYEEGNDGLDIDDDDLSYFAREEDGDYDRFYEDDWN